MTLLRVVEWLLRFVSSDDRSGWGGTAYGRGPKIEYWGVALLNNAGDWLHSPESRPALQAMLDCDGLWVIDTNLLTLFGLPKERRALSELLAALPRSSFKS